MNKPSNPSDKVLSEPIPLWEKMLTELDGHLTSSGRTVVVRGPSDTSEFVATMPQGRRERPASGPLAAGRALRDAYMRTVYSFAHGGQDVAMHIGQANDDAAKLLAECGAEGAVFVTAFNPPHLPPGSVHNQMAMRCLKRSLMFDAPRKNWRVLSGKGEAADGSWPAEPSHLVVGISPNDAVLLGRQFGQNAIVWVDASGMPSLVELTDFTGRAHARRRTPYFPTVHLSVPWGNDEAEITIRSNVWRRILEGEAMGLGTWGYNDGARFRLEWTFDGNRLDVSYGDDGGAAYDGPLSGAQLSLPVLAKVGAGAAL